jgi:uncharacterized protein YjbJ (UPF0337 family)
VDENRIEGAARDLGGKVQDAVGGLTDDAATQSRGKVNQAVGQAQNAYGAAVDDVKDFATGQPIVALLTAMGVGVIIGLVLGRR